MPIIEILITVYLSEKPKFTVIHLDEIVKALIKMCYESA